MYCRNCGAQAADNAVFCTGCGSQLREGPAQPSADNTDKALGLLVPINVSGLALVAGYLGLFSVLLLPAPFAVLLGVLALRDIRNNPKHSGKGRAVFGIVMGSLCSVGLAALLVQICFGH